MPEIEVNVEVYCECGEGLCNQTNSTRTSNRKAPCFIITPCERCLEKARDEGRDQGYKQKEEEIRNADHY